MFVYNSDNNRNHELCSAPFTIRPIDQRCITVKDNDNKIGTAVLLSGTDNNNMHGRMWYLVHS